VEIDRNAPATAEGELGIDADPSTVFSVIAAIDQWPSWNPEVKSVRVEGPVQPGTLFRFQVSDGATLARSEESWAGLLASLLKGYSRRTLDKGIRGVLAYLETEAERRAATA
jgi:hypothetical protein